MPRKTLATLEQELEDLRATFDAYKQRVKDVALEAKEEAEWCEPGFQKAMAKLDLSDATHEVVITTVTTVRVSSPDPDRFEQAYVENSIGIYDSDTSNYQMLAFGDAVIKLDSDFHTYSTESEVEIEIKELDN